MQVKTETMLKIDHIKICLNPYLKLIYFILFNIIYGHLRNLLIWNSQIYYT